jgi:hypothetical protein
MANKVITMTLSQGNTHVTMREVLSDEVTWNGIAYMFYNFLRAQGYYPDPEELGVDVESYVRSIDSVDTEEQW